MDMAVDVFIDKHKRKSYHRNPDRPRNEPALRRKIA